MLLILIKMTVFLAACLLILAVTPKAGAARRHLLCLVAVCGTLLLPLTALSPSTTMVLKLDTAGSISQILAPQQKLFLNWRALAEWLWTAGLVLVMVRLAAGYWKLTRIRRDARSIESDIFVAAIEVPLATGLFRPAVLVPCDFLEWPVARQIAAIRHERAHIARRDLWSNLLANTACAIFWFHPLVWLLRARMLDEQEAACDDCVIAGGCDPADYAEALLEIAKNASGVAFSPGCAMATHRDVRSRIRRVLERGVVSASRSGALIGLAAIVLAFVALAPLAAQTVYKVGGDVASPRVLTKVDPEYTQDARDRKVSGTVALACVIRPDGKAHDITITRHLDPDLDVSAMEAVAQWTFAPGTLRGDPVAVEAVIEVNFRLQ